MGNGQEKAENSTSHTERLRESLEKMIQSVNTINALNMGMATAARQQALVTEEVSQNVMTVSAAIGESAVNAEQATMAGANLTALSAQLQTLVDRFRL